MTLIEVTRRLWWSPERSPSFNLLAPDPKAAGLSFTQWAIWTRFRVLTTSISFPPATGRTVVHRCWSWYLASRTQRVSMAIIKSRLATTKVAFVRPSLFRTYCHEASFSAAT